MFYRWLLALRQPGNTLWLMPTLGACLAFLFVFLAKFINVFIAEDVLPEIREETLDGLLGVIASSMLAVSTFSLSIMVSAFSSAASGTTPRATELVMADDNTRMAIASFISAFIYAIIAKTVLGLGFYGQNGRFVLFVSTLLVLLYLIVVLIRWVSTISHLGGMKNTLEKMHKALQDSVSHYRANPQLGATWQGHCSSQAREVFADGVGYLRSIDMRALQRFAEHNDCYMEIKVRPGVLIFPGKLLLRVEGAPMQSLQDLASFFVLSDARAYDEDSEWGFIVLSEAAQKALPPVSNDSGTAVAIVSIMVHVLLEASEEKNNKAHFDRLAIERFDTGIWVRSGFLPITRDGASVLEVGEMLQEGLAILWRSAPEPEVREAAFLMARSALLRAKDSLAFKDDVAILEALHLRLFAVGGRVVEAQ